MRAQCLHEMKTKPPRRTTSALLLLTNTKVGAKARTEDTKYFIWVPSSKPRLYSAEFAACGAALMGIVSVCAFGNAPLRDFVDAVNHQGIGTELSRVAIVAEPALINWTDLDHSRFEPRGSAEPALMLNYHSKAVMPAKRRRGLELRQLSGEPVRRLQAKLSVQADGEFDPRTEKALKAWQGKNGLAADGIAGPDTLMVMGLYDLVLLQRGAQGDSVKKLQEKLAIGADGRFGPRTQKAVRDYQKKNGLVADGRAGPATLAHIKLSKKVAGDG